MHCMRSITTCIHVTITHYTQQITHYTQQLHTSQLGTLRSKVQNLKPTTLAPGGPANLVHPNYACPTPPAPSFQKQRQRLPNGHSSAVHGEAVPMDPRPPFCTFQVRSPNLGLPTPFQWHGASLSIRVCPADQTPKLNLLRAKVGLPTCPLPTTRSQLPTPTWSAPNCPRPSAQRRGMQCLLPPPLSPLTRSAGAGVGGKRQVGEANLERGQPTDPKPARSLVGTRSKK